nr:hypothetical protein [Leptospira noguchii]
MNYVSIRKILFDRCFTTRTYEDSTKLSTTEFAKNRVFKKCCKFAIYSILEQDQNIQIFETINPSILFNVSSA